MRTTLLLALIMPLPALAADLTVGTTPGCATIQGCIGTASASDSILVPPGTYTEALTFGTKALSIKRSGSSGDVILTRSTAGAIATLGTANIAFYDVIFDGNNARIGINAPAGGSHRLERVTVRKGLGTYGGGVAQQGGTLTVVDSTFTANNTSSGGQGGAIYMNNGALTVSGSTFSGNTAAGGSFGGAIEVTSTGPVQISSSTFSNNTAYNGGGLSTYLVPSVTLTNDLFDTNTATNQGGGYYSHSPSSVSISGTTFDGNAAAAQGGGVWVYNASTGVAIADGTFNANVSKTSTGGGIYVQWSANVQVLRDLLTAPSVTTATTTTRASPRPRPGTSMSTVTATAGPRARSRAIPPPTTSRTTSTATTATPRSTRTRCGTSTATATGSAARRSCTRASSRAARSARQATATTRTLRWAGRSTGTSTRTATGTGAAR